MVLALKGLRTISSRLHWVPELVASPQDQSLYLFRFFFFQKWEFREGWTRYTTDGSVTQVAFPEDRALVFDVEILVDTKYFPTMATAASPDAWWANPFVSQQIEVPEACPPTVCTAPPFPMQPVSGPSSDMKCFLAVLCFCAGPPNIPGTNFPCGWCAFNKHQLLFGHSLVNNFCKVAFWVIWTVSQRRTTSLHVVSTLWKIVKWLRGSTTQALGFASRARSRFYNAKVRICKLKLKLACRYSWCSPRLIRDLTYDDRVRLSDMIPLETRTCEPHRPRRGDWQPRLVIGHNVGFDRSFVKEQYDIKVQPVWWVSSVKPWQWHDGRSTVLSSWSSVSRKHGICEKILKRKESNCFFPLQGTKLRFLDTMSMHIAVGGMTGDQRVLYIARTKGSLRKEVRELQERAAKLREEMVHKRTHGFEWRIQIMKLPEVRTGNHTQ